MTSASSISWLRGRRLPPGTARAHRTVDVDGDAAAATDEVVVVVVHPILEAGRRSRRLDTPDETRLGQDAERVVYRLARDGAELGPHGLLDLVRRGVRPARDRAQDGQALSRHLKTMLAEEVRRIAEISLGHE